MSLCLISWLYRLGYVIACLRLSSSNSSTIVHEYVAWIYQWSILLTHSFHTSGNKMPQGQEHCSLWSEILLPSLTSSLASSCLREFCGSSNKKGVLSLPTSCRQGGLGGLHRNYASPVSNWWLTHEIMREAAWCLKDTKEPTDCLQVVLLWRCLAIHFLWE